MRAFIKGIEYHLPKTVLGNDELAADFKDWTAAQIYDKIGIKTRHIADKNECASDLAVVAAQRLFESGICRREEIDFLLMATQTPDYFLPATACILQNRLGLPTACGALDFNLGCSAYVYGLSLAKGLIETLQARNVLLITADTLSKFLNPGDRSVRTLLGDAATATLVSGEESEGEHIGSFVFGTDGAGAQNLIVPAGGMRKAINPRARVTTDSGGNSRTENDFYMNGPEIFNFCLNIVPDAVERVLMLGGKTIHDVDYFVFHQANHYILRNLQKLLKIPGEKFVISMEHCGNTSSSTIPIALKDMMDKGDLHKDRLLLLLGFGVGYSWGGSLVRWHS